MIKQLIEPLREPKYLAKFLLLFTGFAVLFVAVPTVISLVQIKPFPGLSFELIAFAGLRAFSLFTNSDYVIFVLFPLLAALLWTHYEHGKCVPNGESKKSRVLGGTGVFFGLVMTSCPLCFAAALGLGASSLAVLSPITTAFKWAGVLMLVAALVFVMRKKACCTVPKKR